MSAVSREVRALNSNAQTASGHAGPGLPITQSALELNVAVGRVIYPEVDKVGNCLYGSQCLRHLH